MSLFNDDFDRDIKFDKEFRRIGLLAIFGWLMATIITIAFWGGLLYLVYLVYLGIQALS